jgi:hypothetical protein
MSELNKEQSAIKNVAENYLNSITWFSFNDNGTLLDNFARLCYQRMVNALPFLKDTKRIVAEKDFELYGHQILSHGFMEFIQLSGIENYIENRKDLDWPGNIEKELKPTFLKFCRVRMYRRRLETICRGLKIEK